MNWLIPCRKCKSASAFISSGVARNAGECSHVHVSDEMTRFPKRCPAEAAHRVSENCRHIDMVALPSPSGRSSYRLLESVTGGNPYVCDRSNVLCWVAHSCSGLR